MKATTKDGKAYLELDALDANEIRDAIDTLQGYLAFVNTCTEEEIAKRRQGFDDLKRIFDLNHAEMPWCPTCLSYHADGANGCSKTEHV